MKKEIVTLLCTTVLTLGLTVIPVMASAGPFFPIRVDAYTYGPLDELRINKVYQLSVADDPSGIPTEDFERGGRRYYLLDMVADNTDCEVVTYTAIFGSMELSGNEKCAKEDNGTDLLPILCCAGGVVTVVVIVLCAIKVKRM